MLESTNDNAPRGKGYLIIPPVDYNMPNRQEIACQVVVNNELNDNATLQNIIGDLRKKQGTFAFDHDGNRVSINYSVRDFVFQQGTEEQNKQLTYNFVLYVKVRILKGV